MTLALLLDKATVAPPAGAADVSVTVQVEVPGAFTVPGEQLKLLSCVVTVSTTVADWVTPLSNPVTVTFCALPTVAVVAGNRTLLWFAAIVTVGGTASAALLLLIDMITELIAALFNETVQLVDELLPSDVGEHDTELSCAGALAVRVKVCKAPLSDAERSAVWFELMLPTVAVKDALLCPAPTPTLPGTVMLALLLDKITVAPPAGAAAVIVTVQLELPGAFTVAGEQFRLLGCVVTVNAMVAV